MSKELMDRVRELRAELMGERRTLTIKGLGEDGGPLMVYVYPVTNEELRKIFAEPDAVRRAALAIDLRLRDENGKRLFVNEADEILRTWPPSLLIATVAKINKDIAAVISGKSLMIDEDEMDAAKK